ncbi:MAG TPA: FmdB family zinc ribbon protein [Marmoricola sp.]
MPTYQYSCTECGHFLEAVQKFTDDALTVCPECGGRLRKVFNAVGVVFKGSGFYRTDSRKAPSSSSDDTNGSSGSGASKEPAAAGSSSSSSSAGSSAGSSVSSSSSSSD